MSDELFVREAPLLVVRRAMSPPSAVTPGVEGVHERSSHVVFDPKDAEASIWALEVPLTKFSSAKRLQNPFKLLAFYRGPVELPMAKM